MVLSRLFIHPAHESNHQGIKVRVGLIMKLTQSKTVSHKEKHWYSKVTGPDYYEVRRQGCDNVAIVCIALHVMSSICSFTINSTSMYMDRKNHSKMW